MADVQITITIPEEHVDTVIDAFTNLSDRQVEFNAPGGSTGGNYFTTIVGQVEGEGLAAFGKRFILELISGSVKLWKDIKYNTEVAAEKALIETTTVEKETVTNEIVE